MSISEFSLFHLLCSFGGAWWTRQLISVCCFGKLLQDMLCHKQHQPLEQWRSVHPHHDSSSWNILTSVDPWAMQCYNNEQCTGHACKVALDEQVGSWLASKHSPYLRECQMLKLQESYSCLQKDMFKTRACTIAPTHMWWGDWHWSPGEYLSKLPLIVPAHLYQGSPDMPQHVQNLLRIYYSHSQQSINSIFSKPSCHKEIRKKKIE